MAEPQPSQFFSGSLVLALLLSLSPWFINEQDGYAKYLLLPVIVFALALLSRPVRYLQLFKGSTTEASDSYGVKIGLRAQASPLFR
jgi:hypothetical protein